MNFYLRRFCCGMIRIYGCLHSNMPSTVHKSNVEVVMKNHKYRLDMKIFEVPSLARSVRSFELFYFNFPDLNKF